MQNGRVLRPVDMWSQDSLDTPVAIALLRRARAAPGPRNAGAATARRRRPPGPAWLGTAGRRTFWGLLKIVDIWVHGSVSKCSLSVLSRRSASHQVPADSAGRVTRIMRSLTGSDAATLTLKDTHHAQVAGGFVRTR